MNLCMWRRMQNKETGGGTWRVPAVLPVLRQKFPRYFGGRLEFSAKSLSYYFFWYFDARSVLTSQDDTPPSTPSSVHILPVYGTRNTNISPSHIIQINLSDFLDITCIIFSYFILINCRLSGLYMQPPNNSFRILLTFYTFYHTKIHCF